MAVAAVAALALVASVPGAVVPPTTTLVSTGPAGGNGSFTAWYAGASADGKRVFFQTDEKLVSADTDSNQDVYERSGGTTTLVSTGPAGGNGAFDASFKRASADGSRVFFETNEKLVSEDGDAKRDVYVRSGGTTTLVSVGLIGGNGTAEFRGASTDGSRVFFATDERILAADADSRIDVYERSGGTTTLVSTGPAGGNGAFSAGFSGASADGSRVFLTTAEKLVSSDADRDNDVYMRSGGETTLVSIGPAEQRVRAEAVFRGASADGARVFFETAESLVDGDHDGVNDVYMRHGGNTTLVSIGLDGRGNLPAFKAFFQGASAGGTRVFFQTAEPLLRADTDARLDVYERSGDTLALVSTGPAGGNGAFDAAFRGASADGSRVFFETDEQLVEADQDASRDVYARSGGTTALVSTGPAFQHGDFDAAFRGASANGARVFFETAEQLVTADQDASRDVYVRSGGTTTLVSTGPAGGNGAFEATFMGAADDGSRIFFHTDERLAGGDTDSQKDVYERTTLAINLPR